VANAVREGDVEQRAVIRTGDEFEELAGAFNRMLRQLLSQQSELRVVNDELDHRLDELAQANMKLYEMNRLKSDFLATVSHELRTPLNSILGFSDVLSAIDALDEKQLRYVSNIQRSGRMLLDMINDILDLAKVESGKMEVRLSEFKINALAAAQCDMARPLAEKKNIDLDCEASASLPPLRQDQAKVQQILNNLLSNAIKFTPEGGRIFVSAQRDEQGDLRLKVTDTGIGISPDEQQLVFEKFRQASSALPDGDAMTREYSGTGLGLSIVRELCRLLGGDVSLESELGKGSTFTIRLPWRLEESPKFDAQLREDLEILTRSPRPVEIGTPAGVGTLENQGSGV
jgi:signal transduction histidine kinase